MNKKPQETKANRQVPYDQYQREFQASYEKEPYYREGNAWSDYEPAYKYGYDRFGAENAARKWDEIETDLEQGWERVKGESRLAWAEAKQAVRQGWDRLERAMPGDADNDGR